MRLFLLISALAIVSATSLRADVLVTVAPASQTIATGTTTQVQVLISGLGLDTHPSLGAFDLNLAFDPTIVTFTGLTFGDPMQGDQLDLSGMGAISDFDNQTAGLLEFFEVSLDSQALLDSKQSDHFVLATLHLQAIATGTTSLVPTLNSISDSAGQPLGIGLRTGSIHVIAAPEPSGIWLFPSAAAWIVWRVNRRTRITG